MRLAGIGVLWLAGWLLPGWVAAADLLPLPELKARVTDLTATLSPEQSSRLEEKLQAIETKKGSQVVVLLLPTTQPESIEAFGIRLAEAWKIGRKGSSDGVIVIVAKNDRRMRLEVGYGLEGAIPDAVAKRIVAERMAPRFKQGDFAGGIDSAVDALSGIIDGEALPDPNERPVPDWVNSDVPPENDSNAFGLLLGTLFFSVWIRRLLGLFGVLLAASVAAWAAWMIVPSLLLAGIAFVVVGGMGLLGPLAERMGGASGRRGYGSGSGSWSSGGSSWSSGSSGSSGGGFSGGGGSFGGGGASGDW
jgi:uncharacterized protein